METISLEDFLIEASGAPKDHPVDLGGRLSGMKFIIRPLTLAEWKDARKRAVNPSASGSDRMDSIELTKQTIVTGCVEPNFKDEGFIKKAGCRTPSELIEKVLLSGEADRLAGEVMKISGFIDNLSKAKEEAKN